MRNVDTWQNDVYGLDLMRDFFLFQNSTVTETLTSSGIEGFRNKSPGTSEAEGKLRLL